MEVLSNLLYFIKIVLLAESMGLSYILKYDSQIQGWDFLTLSRCLKMESWDEQLSLEQHLFELLRSTYTRWFYFFN